MKILNKKIIIITTILLVVFVIVFFQKDLKNLSIFNSELKTSTQTAISEKNIIDVLKSIAQLLQTSKDLIPLIDIASKADYVLLGEASHGTSEYYTKRTEITKQLIKEKEFSLIALEADWAATYKVNLFIKGQKYQNLSTENLLKQTYQRWPQWMWANKEFAELVSWLKKYNETKTDQQKIGIYGMDMYGWMDSINEVNEYLEKTDKKLYINIKQLYSILKTFADNPHDYVRNIVQTGKHSGKNTEKVIEILSQNKEKLIKIAGAENYFNIYQNAIVIKNAERHHRAMLERGADSWNIRAHHFAETVENLMNFYENKKIIVWAHNTHIGDARATDMKAGGQVNIGQLLRETHTDEKIFSIGFGSYQGTVLAGKEWGEKFTIFNLPPAQKNSVEYKMNSLNKDKILFMFDFKNEIPTLLVEPYGHRAVGVVYNPKYEHLGNYIPTVLPERYNAFIFIKRTNALIPL